jgi:prepilin-type processing-associated H-X9-DG protein
VGEPGRGSGKKQPGGWAYSILPYTEQQALFSLGDGLAGTDAAAAGLQRSSTPLALYTCPTRRGTQTLPLNGTSGLDYRNWPGQVVTGSGRTDYAACAGSKSNSAELFEGPPDFASGDSDAWWTANKPEAADPNRFNGVIFTRSTIRIPDVTRGTSNTIMIGEKFVPVDRYATGTDGGDNECMYTGHDNDVNRTTYQPPVQDKLSAEGLPADPTFRFGSAHIGGLNVVLADGSVRTVPYSVDAAIWTAYGDRTSTAVGSLD